MGARASHYGIALAVLLASIGAVAHAQVRGTDFSSERWNVSLAAPSNWQLTEATPYENVLLVMVTRSPRGTMMLSAQRVEPGVDAAELAQSTANLLDELGFETTSPQLHPATGAYWIDITGPGALLRQAFLASGEVGYALTLSAQSSRERAHHLRAFDAVLRSIRVDRPPTRAADTRG
jgi:hypothetical protein